ncbi:DNA-binding response regulator, NarL/FixJ family, contains REC and HTH domains [Micromonospora phaseoli]|uniref:DNA-binding response regulator, NarL/FixJ family, contains REC and HTH domains n=1 Tax=Micromonospora phaseoli TaxID=1144548 RepID=A0A1H6SRN3_9ACTN|nr:response regulator transcription factor [Micromonospora phaseoli]PZW04041.1 LuxR family two component transcriptional regulator [Micromonospora phaseoli]GIJ81379.1 DNA-binding response regulator [Micromonospora phaseoli]SEI69536.1 DNA-binding response regulator, NarL/FixJ family, contains REC and HTH domains [Micromonospora phaseoli]
MSGPARPIRVLLADDHHLVRTGFRVILEVEDDIEVVGEAADGERAVGMARALRPDVVLMDVEMPGVDGLAATRRISADADEPGGPAVLILTTFDRDDYLFAALRAGASGFLLKNGTPETLIEAIRVVARGDGLLAPELTRRVIATFARPGAATGGLAPEAALRDLTPREREVLVLIAGGASNAEIAAALHLGEATVKSHVSRVLAKLGLRDRVQAVVFAYEHGVVRPSG